MFDMYVSEIKVEESTYVYNIKHSITVCKVFSEKIFLGRWLRERALQELLSLKEYIALAVLSIQL
ncbi:hypothetical protein NUACC21_24940 [Scytonema sp. NUACC21]